MTNRNIEHSIERTHEMAFFFKYITEYFIAMLSFWTLRYLYMNSGKNVIARNASILIFDVECMIKYLHLFWN